MKTYKFFVLVPFLIALTVPFTSCQSVISSVSGVEIGEKPQKAEDEYIENPGDIKVEVWQQGLEVPWSLVFLPDGNALVSERAGKILFIKDGKIQDQPYYTFENVYHEKGKEAGLMGLTLHPDFGNQPYVYAYYTLYENGNTTNRVVRLRHKGNRGEMDKIIIEDIPAGDYHDGGRIKFGPDGLLYVTTGEITKEQLAQDMNSKGGKFLRVTDEGDIPEDNPFKGSMIYSLGHRNPQGFEWHPQTGELFSSEHGPSGEMGLFGKDEVNIIRKGENYGWPEAVGAVKNSKFTDPIIMWDKAVPPGGVAFWNGDLFIATMKDESLVHITLKRNKDTYEVTGIEHWFASSYGNGRYGRLRDVETGPDGALYVLTTNRDGRGNPENNDDKILRITKP